MRGGVHSAISSSCSTNMCTSWSVMGPGPPLSFTDPSRTASEPEDTESFFFFLQQQNTATATTTSSTAPPAMTAIRTGVVSHSSAEICGAGASVMGADSSCAPAISPRSTACSAFTAAAMVPKETLKIVVPLKELFESRLMAAEEFPAFRSNAARKVLQDAREELEETLNEDTAEGAAVEGA